MTSNLRPSLLSTVLVSFFLLALGLLAFMAEVFQSQTQDIDFTQIYANPVPMSELQKLSQVHLVNKNGDFILENTHPSGDISGPWQMIHPGPLKLRAQILPSILNALDGIRVRNFHQQEPINITSFSLDNPTLKIIFKNLKGRETEVKLGLINPIDNSAYLTVSDQEQIFQIDPMSVSLESYDLSLLAESKVFALNLNSLTSLEIYKNGELNLHLLRQSNVWQGPDNKILSEKRVESFFNKIDDIKTYSLLEKLSQEQHDFMKNIFQDPEYEVRFNYANSSRSFYLGKIKKGIPGMSSIKKDSYVLSTSSKDDFVLIDKSEMSVLTTQIKNLK